MILVKIEERYGEDDWSEHFQYYTYSEVDDYGTKLTETTILEEFFGGDSERIELSRVRWVKELTETELETLLKFNIVY
jgi:hypothetical protein